MSVISPFRVEKAKKHISLRLGTVGYLASFGWMLAMVLLAPTRLILPAAILCVAAAILIFSLSVRQLWRPRRLGMIVLLVLPSIFWGEPDMVVRGIPISGTGLLLGLQMVLRAIVILVAVNGLTSAVEISSLAGVFERLGLRGLGFSLGVALNLLPSLQQSSLNAWRSLKMRGGLRRQRRRSLQLLAITIVTNALHRAEEVALAAEARAFSPECCRALPIKTGNLDWVVILVGSLLLIVFTMFV